MSFWFSKIQDGRHEILKITHISKSSRCLKNSPRDYRIRLIEIRLKLRFYIGFYYLFSFFSSTKTKQKYYRHHKIVICKFIQENIYVFWFVLRDVKLSCATQHCSEDTQNLIVWCRLSSTTEWWEPSIFTSIEFTTYLIMSILYWNITNSKTL